MVRGCEMYAANIPSNEYQHNTTKHEWLSPSFSLVESMNDWPFGDKNKLMLFNC